MSLPGDYGPDTHDENRTDKAALSIHGALRADPGPCVVEGMLVSISPVFKMISREVWKCGNCGRETITEHPHMPASSSKCPTQCIECNANVFSPSHEFVNALSIELKDQAPVNELESLRATLFGEDTEYPRAGEVVTAGGELYVENVKGKLSVALKVESIQYRNRRESALTDKDIESFKRFAKMAHLRGRLISMTALPVVGDGQVKVGILRSLVGAPASDHKRGRVNTALVGDRGTAKSVLAREATKMTANSRYVTAQNASGKSLTAIVDKSNDTTTLRLGPVPLAKGSICSVNEAGLMDPDDQKFLLDVLEEGYFVVSKHGITAQIDSPTTLILTANQHNAQWQHLDAVSDDEMPFSKTMLDRIDQVYIFRDSSDLDAAKAYALKKSEIDRKAHRFNYNFIRKYLQYARSINPELTPETEAMLNEYWINMKVAGRAGPRALEALKRIALAQARLYLMDTVTVEVAKEVMTDYSKMLTDYGRTVATTHNPRDVAYDLCLEILKGIRWPVTFEELIRLACEKNEQVLHYLIGETKLDKNNAYKLRNNYKLRPILDMLLDHSCIKMIQQKPVTLKWLDETSDKSSHSSHSSHTD